MEYESESGSCAPQKRFITIRYIHVYCTKLRVPQSYILYREHKLIPSTQRVYWKTSEEDIHILMK